MWGRRNLFVGETIFAGDIDSVAEVGTDFLDAESSGVTTVPGSSRASAVGDPKEGGGEVDWVFESEPEIAVEDDSGPGEGLFFGSGFVDHHDEVVVSWASGIAGEVGVASVGKRDGC